MKASRYNIATNHSDSGDTILFNSLYGTTVVIDADTLPTVMQLLKHPSCAHTTDRSDVLGFLIRGKFIVNDDIDELGIVKHRKLCGIKDKNRADVIVMPNLCCNFACPYCYEHHDHSNRMTKEVESSIATWLDKIIDTHKVVLLSWFGGEPLLSYKTILSLGSHASARSKKRGVNLLTNITTNGYALNPSMIEALIALEIFNYQITVDGPPDMHDKMRVLVSGEGTFKKVHSNILDLARADKRVKISLRVNYNHNNLHSIPELLSLFPTLVRPQLRVVYEPIFGDDQLSATENITGEEISSSITRYYDLARKMGFDVVLGGLGIGKLAYCYAEREDQYILNYNGDVFKCSVTDFTPSERVGYIDSNGEFVKNSNKWNAWFDIQAFEDKCEECKFLPLCMGGCRKDRIENRKTGNHCNLVPTNTSHALKSIAFGSFNELLKNGVTNSCDCATNMRV